MSHRPFDPLVRSAKNWKPTPAVFNHALALYKNIDSAAVDEAESLLLQSEKAKTEGDVNKEIALLRRAYTLVPVYPRVLFTLAYETQWRLKDRELAQKLYERYLENFPGYPDSIVALIYSMTWYLTRDPEQALELYKKHGNNIPGDKDFNTLELLKIKCLLNLGQTKLARAEAEKLLVNPRFSRDEELREFFP